MPPIIRFTWRNYFYGSSYPEGNFGVNQLLDGSMGLSPLYSALTSDLHVNTATIFHRSFLRLQSIQAQFTIFRVPTYTLQLKSLSRQNQDRLLLHPCGFTDLPFSSLYEFNTLKLAHMLDSLVRVSRRVVCDHFIKCAASKPECSWRSGGQESSRRNRLNSLRVQHPPKKVNHLHTSTNPLRRIRSETTRG